MLVIKVIKKEIRRLKKETRNLFFNMVFGVFNLVAVSLFYKDILLTVAILGLLTVLLFVYYRSPILIAVFVFCTVFGAFSEIFSVGSGVWSYTLVDFFNIPLWLFLLWGNAGLFIYRTAIEFERLGFHK